ncbi:MAG: hypothetical protein RL060_454 [Bacteroidota bacterium]|jgi:protein CpxP
MKKIIILLSSIALTFGVVNAQNADGVGASGHETHNHEHSKHHIHRANHRAEHLTKQLGLTPEQKQKIHTLCIEEAAKVDAFKKTHAADLKAMNKEIKLVGVDFKKHMKSILTAEQYAKWEKLKKAEKKKVDNQSPDSDNLDD